MANKSFVMYDSWMDMVEDMTEEEAGRLLKAIYAYRKDKNAAPDDRTIRPVFNILRQRFEEDAKAYQEKVEKRAEAGKMGGRPKAKESKSKQTKAKKANAFFEKQKNPVTDTVTDTVPKTKTKYSDDPILNASIEDFLKYRKEIKKPMGDIAVTRFLERLNKLGKDTKERIGLINNAIEHGWLTVYPEKTKPKAREPSFSDQRKYDYDDLERRLLAR